MNPVWNLFLEFLKIGLLSIGGGYAIIPLIREQVVEKTGWISEKMFTDIITISQMTPGPLAVNTSTFVGLQIGGFAGALAATAGCVLCGVIISLVLYCFFPDSPKVCLCARSVERTEICVPGADHFGLGHNPDDGIVWRRQIPFEFFII